MKKEPATKAQFNPLPLKCPIFMLFLTCYQELNFVKKPQCIKVLEISERTNAFSKSFKVVQSTFTWMCMHMNINNGVFWDCFVLGVFWEFLKFGVVREFFLGC